MKTLPTKIELKLGWQKLTVLKELRDRTKVYSDMPPLRSTEFEVLCFIAHQNGNANITAMVNHPYFNKVSQSTVKRAVLVLTETRLIQATEGDDRRERFLSVTE